jgi:hypothetical protein
VRNEAEANRDAADRKAVLDGLERQLKKGDKALVGNSAYRRFLKTTTRPRPNICVTRAIWLTRELAVSALRPRPWAAAGR